MSREQIITTQQFVDQMGLHRGLNMQCLEKILPAEFLDIVLAARRGLRETFGLKPEDFVVILGEQAYGLNEPPKVLGKRVLAKALANTHGTETIELFATYDVVGSEEGIRRMQLPNPYANDGIVAVNMLPGWKKGKNVATAGFRAPTLDELAAGFATIQTLYGKTKAESLKGFIGSTSKEAQNYADMNVRLLRSLEAQIGLQFKTWATENILDSLIAKNGGMQIILQLWPKIWKAAKTVPAIDGVRVPDISETPFYLYHTSNGCFGRMQSTFDMGTSGNYEISMETPVHSTCMHCGHSEQTTPYIILEALPEHPITWRAIPRVILYSSVGLADGHITGGGSIYNGIAERTMEEIGLSYFPHTHMSKNDLSGNRVGVFEYKSSADGSGRGWHLANQLVTTGGAAMADLFLSIGVHNLRTAIEEAVAHGVTTGSRIVCPAPIPKNTAPLPS